MRPLDSCVRCGRLLTFYVEAEMILQQAHWPLQSDRVQADTLRIWTLMTSGIWRWIWLGLTQNVDLNKLEFTAL